MVVTDIRWLVPMFNISFLCQVSFGIFIHIFSMYINGCVSLQIHSQPSLRILFIPLQVSKFSTILNGK